MFTIYSSTYTIYISLYPYSWYTHPCNINMYLFFLVYYYDMSKYASNGHGHPPIGVSRPYRRSQLECTLMAMAISGNWLFLWDYTFYKLGYKYL
jgi:hypothetical protein